MVIHSVENVDNFQHLQVHEPSLLRRTERGHKGGKGESERERERKRGYEPSCSINR